MSVVSRLRAAGFKVYTREQWGTRYEHEYAKRAANPYYRLDDPVDHHFLHITVTRDTDTIRQGFEGARQVEGYGYTTPPMVSYQMLTTNEGVAYEGQNYGVKGTHTVNDKNVPGFPDDLNRHGYAVALMQNVWDEVTDEQVNLIAACFAAAELEGHVRKGAAVHPHRTFAAKDCPGDKAVARLADIERLKNEYVLSGLGTPPEDDMPTPDELLDQPINVHDPKGQLETRSVTLREVFTALVIQIERGPKAAREYLDDARRSRAPK